MSPLSVINAHSTLDFGGCLHNIMPSKETWMKTFQIYEKIEELQYM